jgi:hypothetical protein
MQHLRNTVAPAVDLSNTRLRGKKPHPCPPQLVSPDAASPRKWARIEARYYARRLCSAVRHLVLLNLLAKP